MMNIELARLISLKLQLIRRGTGIYIAESGVYLAEVSRVGTTVVLSKSAYEPFPADMDDLSVERQSIIVSEMVLKCYQAAGIKPSTACSSPPPGKIVTRYFQLPMLPHKERKEAIQFEGSRYVPFKLNETVSNFYFKEAPNKQHLEVVFNAIPIDILRAHVNAIEDAHIKLWDAEPPFYSLVRAVREKIGKTQDPTLVVHIAADGSVCLCLMKNHIFYVCRDFYLSFDDQRYLEKFFMEVNSSLEYFKRQTGDQNHLKIILGGSADLSVWKTQIEQYFQDGTKVEIADFPVAKGFDAQNSSGLLIPIGLALKAIGVPSPMPDISLLETGAVAEERIAARKRTGAVILISLLVGVLFYFAYFLPQLNKLKEQVTATNASVSQLSTQFPDISSQPIEVLEQRVANVEEKTQLIEAFQKGRSFIYEKLLILSKTVPPSIWFTDLLYKQNIPNEGKLAVKKRELVFNGYVYFRDIPEEELRQINEYADALRKNEAFMSGFKSVDLKGLDRTIYADRGFTKFKIICVSNQEGE